MRKVSLLILMVATLTAAGCQPPIDNDMQTARAAYEAEAWQRAVPPARRVVNMGGYLRTEAAFIAGMSSYRMGDLDAAVQWLTIARDDRNRQRAGEAYATLGRIDDSRGRLEPALEAYVEAAQHLSGPAAADNWYRAAEVARKLNRPTQARSYYTLARAATDDADLRTRSEQARDVSGWTIQIGPYNDKEEARAVAQLLAHQSRNLQVGDPRLLTVLVEGGEHAYVVHVGQFARYETAAAARKQINVDKTVVVPLNQWVTE